MKIKAPAKHDLAQLMDALTEAGLLESGRSLTYDADDPTMLLVPAKEGVKEADVRKVLQAHQPAEKPPRPTKADLKAKVSAASNVAQLKAAVLEVLDGLPG